MAAAVQRAKQWARAIKKDVVALYIAGRDPRTPWYAKALAMGVAAYALSPIDLIPDFVPILGYLDDLIIVPLGIRLVVALIPPELMTEYRRAADERGWLPAHWAAAWMVITMWTLSITILAWWVYQSYCRLM